MMNVYMYIEGEMYAFSMLRR